MNEKEKIQNIFKNIIMLILEYNKVNINKFSEITEQIFSNYNNLSKHILDINSQLSNYQLRPNYDQDPEYIKRINQLKREIEEAKKKSQALKDNFEFTVGQTQLDMDKLDSLLEDLNFMIEDL